MRRILILIGLMSLLLLTASRAYAVANGPYLGLGAGVGTIRSPGTPLFETTSFGTSTQNYVSRTGLSGRAFVGFNFNTMLGLEGGYAYYAQSKYQANLTTHLLGTANAKQLYKEYTWDLVGKVYLYYKQFNVYLLGGAAYVKQTITYSNNGIPYNPNYDAPPIGDTHIRRTRPKVGAGAAVQFNPNFIAGIEYAFIKGLFNQRYYYYAIPNLNLTTAYVAYNFG